MTTLGKQMMYRGKYPRRIHSVWQGALRDFNKPELGYSFWARTNDGTLFAVVGGTELPKVGRDVKSFPNCIEQEV